MLIYLSGGGVAGVWRPVNEAILKWKGPRLLSNAYVRLLWSYCELARSLDLRGSRLLVDSGAFTAWTKGLEVNRDALAKVFAGIVERYDHLFDELHLINLDRIPGRYGTTATREEIADAMVESMNNYRWLCERFPGRVLPVFHQDEPEDYLQELEALTDYVCLSPRNDVAERLRVQWAQQMHGRKRYHGLATTGNRIMETVEWYSVDSASWVMVGGMGNIMWMRGERLTNLSVSDSSPNLRKFDKHLQTHALSRVIADTIAARGYDPVRMASRDTDRYIWNADILTNHYKPRRDVVRGGGLFA